VSRTAASGAVDPTLGSIPPGACYEMLRPDPAIHTDAASLSAAREASLVESR